MIDPRFRVFAPPVEVSLTQFDAGVASWNIGLQSAIILAALVFALCDCAKSKSPVLLLLLIGGAITNLAEPFVDLVGACWHPIIHQHTLFKVMDRPMPLWLLFSYAGYFGALTMLTFHAFNKGVTTRAIWLWFFVPLVFDIIMEEVLLHFSSTLYVYYGNQPLRIHNFPIWWAAPNSAGVLVGALLTVLVAPRLRGWRIMLVALITILSYAGAIGFVALPSIIVINSEFPAWVTQLGGIASYLIAFLVVHGCARAIATDRPQAERRRLEAANVTKDTRRAGQSVLEGLS